MHSVAFYCRPAIAIDVISGRFVGLNIRDKTVKFRDPRLNIPREIPPEAVGGVIFGHFSNVCNFRPEAKVATDVIFLVAVEPTGMNQLIKAFVAPSGRRPPT